MLERHYCRLCLNSNKSIIMRSFTSLLLILFSFSCQPQTKVQMETREITLNDLKKDSVIVFVKGNDTLNIYREVEIIHNENDDTLMLGFGIIPPRFVGKGWFAQIDLSDSNAEDLGGLSELDPSKPWSFSKLFTIGLWKKHYDKGFKKIVIRLKVKPSVDDSSTR
jgi:hypothetical protein